MFDLSELEKKVAEATLAVVRAGIELDEARPEDRAAKGAELEAAQKNLKIAKAEFSAALPQESFKSMVGKLSGSNMVGVASFTLIMVIVLIVAIRVDGVGNFLSQLASVDYARGVITGIVVLVTSLIAVILLFSAISLAGKDLKESFDRGKEVLTILVGIMGTCLGFYFSTDHGSVAPLTVSEPRIQLLSAEKKIVLAASVTGGKAPWSYQLEFEGDKFKVAVDGATGESADGLIQVIADAAEGTAVPPSSVVKGKLHVKDSAGIKQTEEFEIKPPK